MSALEQLQAEVTLVADELTEICRRYKYDVVPTIILRHVDGADKSLMLSTDSPALVVRTVAELGAVGNESDLSPREAVLRLFTS